VPPRFGFLEAGTKVFISSQRLSFDDRATRDQ
jgi:hypothetical protein